MSGLRSPVVAFMALGPLKMFAFVRSQNLERPPELPDPSLHIFSRAKITVADFGGTGVSTARDVARTFGLRLHVAVARTRRWRRAAVTSRVSPSTGM